MAKRKRSGIPGMSFSWKRAVGISSAKQKFARATGIPTTKSGRQRKAGKLLGCLMQIMVIACAMAVLFVLLSIA